MKDLFQDGFRKNRRKRLLKEFLLSATEYLLSSLVQGGNVSCLIQREQAAASAVDYVFGAVPGRPARSPW